MAETGNEDFAHESGKTFYLVVEAYSGPASPGQVHGVFSTRALAQEFREALLLLDKPVKTEIEVFYLDDSYVSVGFLLSTQRKNNF